MSKKHRLIDLVGILVAILTIGDLNRLLVSANKINERRILLPYNSGVPTNFTLETSGETSCYKWSSSRPDIASVKHLVDNVQSASSNDQTTDSVSNLNHPLIVTDAQCSRRAIVTVVSTLPKRQSTVITAHDLKTNQQIRCDVEIDVIDKITIQTTTKEIVYGEQPESIKAYAYSAKNDMFTCIGGIQFDWILTPSDVLRYRSWSASPYASPDYVEYWESRGAKSGSILVEGVKTGSARIRASILGDAYRHVPSAEINIHVVANLLLIPPNDVFLVPGARVRFRAEISKQGPRQPLNLPNQQYYLEVSDNQVAMFDNETNMLEAIQQGHTSLILKDRNMIVSPSATNDTSELLFSRTRTDIHVQQPGYISMTIQPGDSSFQLCEDFQYELQLTLHDDWHHALYPSDNLDFELQFDPEYLQVLESTKNKTFYIIRTLKRLGRTKLTAMFHGAGNYRLPEPLTNTQDATIHTRLTLQPEQIYLPYIAGDEENTKVNSYTVNVDARGATGDGYNWQSTNESLAIVKYSPDKSDHATIFTKGFAGQVQITCTDVHNSLIFNAQMLIHLLPVDAVQVLPSIVEAPVGGTVLLPIAVLAAKTSTSNKPFYFDDCSHVKFEVEIVQKNRIRFVEDSFVPGIGQHSCRSLSFECLQSGDSRLTITYHASPDKKIFTHANIGCYKPLQLVHPEPTSANVILSLGAGIDLAFEGGPRPWSMYPEGHYNLATATNESIVQLKEIRDRYRYNKDLHVFRAYCQQYGQTKIDLKVGNTPSATLPNPASTVSTVSIVCARPETLIIKPKRIKQLAGCPQQEQQFTMEKNRPIELDVQVLDHLGRSFYNVSTLYFEWSKDVSMGLFEETSSVREQVNGANGYQMLTRSYQIVTGLTAPRTRIRCRVTGYKNHRLYSDQFDIRREIELLSTEPLVTNEDVVTILKHPDYHKQIDISKGSGYFSVDWSGKQMIQVEWINNNDKRKFMIKPQLTGSGIITITDQCLDYAPYTLQFSVVEPIDIKVQMVDKIELGHKVDAMFYVLDNRGNRLHSSLHQYLDFVISISNDFLSTGAIVPKTDYLSTFTVKAERLGHSKLMIQSQAPKIERLIQSSTFDVQVFSPLQIVPNNLTLIVGNVFQPWFIGGPQTQRNVELMIDDETVAKTALNPNGLIEALKIGKTRLTARVLSVNNYEYSRAQADLYVLPLRKVKLWIPINQMLMGTSVPIYLIGQSDVYETPFMFGHADPALKITWTLSNDNIGTLESSFGQPKHLSDRICSRFVARNIGMVTVKVTVQVSTPAKDPLTEQLHRNQRLVDSIQIQVLPNYVLSVSSEMMNTISHVPGRSLLMSPQSELIIVNSHHKNDADLDAVSYHLRNSLTQVRLLNQSGTLLIQAGDRLESNTLMIKRSLVHGHSPQDGLLHEHFSVAIQVEKVRYLQLELDNSFKSNFDSNSIIDSQMINLATFPIGSEISLMVHYYDQLGRRFDSVKSNLKWRLSRNDIVTVIVSQDSPSAHSLLIRSLKHGQVVMSIWDEVNQDAKQFYKIIVASLIEPSSPTDESLILQMGDVVCMRSRFEPDTGLWSTALDSNLQPPIAWIHGQTGLLMALNPGKTSVIYNHSSTMLSTYKMIQVEPITRLRLNSESIVGVSTISAISIPLIMNGPADTSSKQHDATNIMSQCSLNSNQLNDFKQQMKPFGCDVMFSDQHQTPEESSSILWNVDVQYNFRHNHWSCVLTPKPLSLELSQWNSYMFDRNVTITVFTNDMLLLSNGHSGQSSQLSLFHQVQIPFYPPFQVSTKQVLLSTSDSESDANQARFTVYCTKAVLDDLTVQSSNDEIIAAEKVFVIDEQSVPNQLQSNSLKIVVSLRNADIFSDHVSNLHLLLTSKLTNQTEVIPVQIKLYASHWFAGATSSNRMKELLMFSAGSMTAGSSLYYLSTILMTVIISFSLYALIKRLILDQQQTVVYVDRANTSPASSIYQSSTTPKSPRIIDYKTRTPSPVAGSSPSTARNLIFGGGSQPSTPAQPSSPASNTPSRVGRPLYSTRSIFT